MFAAQSDAVDHCAVVDRALHQRQLSAVVTDTKVAFGKECHILARDLKRLQGFTENALAVAMRIEVSLA